MTYPRYPAYKDSGVEWLGEVPEHWEVKPILAVARERDEPNIGMKENNLLSLSYGNIVRKDINTNDGLLPESFETYQVVYDGDLIFRLTDLQNDKRSLRTAIVNEEMGIITSAYVAVKPVGISPGYLSYLLRAYDETKVFYSMGGGLRQSMKFADLKRMPVMSPSQEEQGRIAAFLDQETAKIDGLVVEQEKLIELLKEKRQALISHAVTKGLDPNATMKDSGTEWLGEVPDHWEIKPLKAVSTLQTGLTLGKKYEEPDLITRPYLRVANVQDGYLSLDDISEVELPPLDAPRYELLHGDVLMTEGGDFDKLGRGYIWEGQVPNCLHQNHIFAVRANREVLSPRFLALTMSSNYGKTYFTATSKQSTNLASTNSTKLKNFPLPIPNCAEQSRIVTFLEQENFKLDDLLGEAKRAIDLLKERRSALISAAVTGKIDVRGIVERGAA